MAQRIAPTGPEQPTLTEQQQQAAELVATGRTLGDVAATVGVDRSTLFRWRRLPDFVDTVASLRLEARVATVATLRANAIRAGQVIRELLDDAQVPPQVRLSAAKIALDHNPSFAVVEWGEAQERVTADPWDALLIRTALEAAELRGKATVQEVRRCSTVGQHWAAAGLSESCFRHLGKLRDKRDLSAATTYCDGVLAERRARLDAAAFGDAGDEDEDAA
jgi:transposase-like protein